MSVTREIDPKRLQIAEDNGIKNVDALANAAIRADVSFAVACALVTKESYGGENIWGNDEGGVFAELPRTMTVTKGAFEVFEYKVVTLGETSNGVGPAQITWPGFFPDARKKGIRLWVPEDNLTYGLGLLRLYKDAEGASWEDAGTRYNGARTYGVDFVEVLRKWRRLFR